MFSVLFWSAICVGGGCFLWEKKGKTIKKRVKDYLKTVIE